MAGTDTFEIGVVRDAHGLGGAVRVQLFDPTSSSLRRGQTLRLRAPGGALVVVTIRSAAEIPGKPGAWRVETDELHDRDAALAVRGHHLEIERAASPPPADDEFYLADAIGRPVRRHGDADETRTLGVVAAITSNGAQDLFEVEYRSRDGRTRTWLLPVVPHMIREVTREAVWVELPLGLLPDELEVGDG